MGTKWCPACGSEWWSDATECRDCGGTLEDQRPSDVDRDTDRSATPGELTHELAHLDLPDLDEAGRWRLTLVLDLDGVVHQWRGTTLTLPERDVPLVTAELSSGGPVFDDVPPTGPRSQLPAAPPVPTRPPRLARTLAVLLDLVVLLIVGMSLGVFLLESRTYDAHGELVSVTRPSLTSCLIYAGIVLLYATLFVEGFGKTPGMALTGVEVVDVDGRRLRGLPAFIRAVLALGWLVVPPILAALELPRRYFTIVQVICTLWPVLILATIVGDPRGRGIHDQLVGSAVRTSTRRRPAGGG